MVEQSDNSHVMNPRDSDGDRSATPVRSSAVTQPIDRVPPLERILMRLPGSRPLWAVLIGAVPVAAAFAPHAYVATVGEATLGRRLIAGAVFGYAVALAVLAVSYFSRQLVEVGRSLEEQMAAGDLFKRQESLAGPLALTLAFSTVTILRTASLTDIGYAIKWLPVSLITNFPLMSAFWLFVVMFLGLRRLGGHQLSLDAFPRDPSLGLSSVGRLAYTAFWVYAAASAPILVVNVGEPTRLAMSLVVFIAGVVAFFVSLAGLHRQLLAARSKEIEWARGLFATTYESVRSGTPEALQKGAETLLASKAIVDEAEAIQRWPFEDRRFRQIAAIIGTFATFTATGVVTRFVVLQLGLD